jgi:hypothetical protein
MSKQTGSQAKIAAAPGSGLVHPVAETARPRAVGDREEARRLAYSHREARGCPEGSPEEDWFRAPQDVNARAAE